MTKRLTLAFFLLSMCGTIRAQVKIGVEFGPDFPRILNILQGSAPAGGSVSQNSQSITRFYCGFLADIPVDKRQQFIIRPSLLYLGAGGQTPELTDFNGNVIESQTAYHFDYVELPLQLLYSPNLSFGKPWIGGGLYGGVLFNAGATGSRPEYLTIGNGQGDDVKRFDLGYTATAGFTFKFGVLAGVDFQQSFGTIVPNLAAGAPKVRNSVWGVHVGYIASIGGGSRSSH
jgi:hypothetical protein